MSSELSILMIFRCPFFITFLDVFLWFSWFETVQESEILIPAALLKTKSAVRIQRVKIEILQACEGQSLWIFFVSISLCFSQCQTEPPVPNSSAKLQCQTYFCLVSLLLGAQAAYSAKLFFQLPYRRSVWFLLFKTRQNSLALCVARAKSNSKTK